jgi:hypothetical protein
MTDITQIPLGKLVASEDNVRRTDAGVQELAGSIAAHGLLQSLVVRQHRKGKSRSLPAAAELDPEQPDITFGLLDLGMSCPELDSVSLSEIELAAEVSGLAVQRDPAFIPAKSISVYADDARERGLIEV